MESSHWLIITQLGGHLGRNEVKGSWLVPRLRGQVAR